MADEVRWHQFQQGRGERKEEIKGEIKRGDVLYTVQTWWEGGAVGEEGGDFFSLPGGGFFFGS